MKSIRLLLVSGIFLSGCSKVPICPDAAFQHVKEDVCQRTTEQIFWVRDSSCEMQDWLAAAIKNPLSAEQAVEIVLLNNPELKASYETLGVAQAQLVQAGLFQNPVFSASFRYENLAGPASLIDLGLVQNLLDILLKPMKKKMAAEDLEVVKYEVSSQVLGFIAETKKAYYSLQVAEQMLALKKEALVVAELAAEAGERLFRAGNISTLALTAKQADFEQMKSEVYEAEIQAFDSSEKLHVLMGLCDRPGKWNLEPCHPAVIDETIDLSNLEEEAVTQSLELKTARKKMVITALKFGIQRAEIVFPNMGFGPDSEKEPEGTWYIGPQFSIGIPLFDIGLAKQAEGRSVLGKLWNSYVDLSIKIASEARSARFRFSHAQKKLRQLQDVVVPLKEEVTHQTLLMLNAMQLGVFDLLEAKQQEVGAKLEAAAACRDYWISKIEVDALRWGRKIRE